MFERLIAPLVIIVLAVIVVPQSSLAKPADDKAQQAILVTGASSGIGLNIAKTLATQLIAIDEDELALILNVNLMGIYRVTKAFAPLIIESKVRISNISTISGILSDMFWAPYQMSKHALEAYTDSLAAEMALFDVQVSAINPGK